YPSNRTLPYAISITTISVPTDIAPTPKKERKTSPIARITNDKNIVLSILILQAILGANGDKIAKASNGNVVNVPVIAWLNYKSVRINEIKAPTDVKGALKLAANKIIPIIKSHLFNGLIFV